MSIENFLKNHPKINVSREVLLLCKLGETKMTETVDQIHDDSHISRLLDKLQLFLSYYPNHSKINFEILLLSICWHDVWKAQRQTYNPIKLLYYQLYEGIGSMIFFSKYSIGIIPNNIIKEVNYAIRKHAQFQFLPTETIEAKILRDIDDLDILNAGRLRPLLKKRKTFSPFTIAFGKWYIDLQSSEATLNNFEFTWTKMRARKINKVIKKIFLFV